MEITLEICCDSADSVQAAIDGGADRIELCSALSEGGVTPSPGLQAAAVATGALPIYVLIRPRGGDFLYTEREWHIIYDDISRAGALGARGVVIGALDADGHLDVKHLSRAVQEAGPMDITFHRAFDMCSDPRRGLQELMDLGIRRVLTSGQQASAETGAACIRQWMNQVRGQISLMPGCGVNARNVAHILRETGATEVHASARALQPSLMRFCREDVKMGAADRDEFSRYVTDVDEVCRLRAEIDRHADTACETAPPAY